jgi:chromosome segregation ATPase
MDNETKTADYLVEDESKDLADLDKEEGGGDDESDGKESQDNDVKTDGEQESKDAPRSEAKQTEQEHEFDKVRQQVQQELANERRRSANLEQRLIELQQQQAKPSEQSDEEREIDDPLEELKRLASVNDKLQKRVESLESGISNRDQAEKEAIEYANSFKRMDKEYGADLRNDAIRHAKTMAIQRGYTLTPGSVPSTQETIDLIELGYAKALREQKLAPVADRRPVKSDIPKKGTTPTKTSAIKGDPETVLEDMRKNGKFRNILVEE